MIKNWELMLRRLDGTEFWASITSSGVVLEDGKMMYFDGIMQDVSKQKAVQEKLQYLATHDTLTGMPNRVLLEDRLSQAIKKADRTGTLVGVLFMDLNGFKAVNDAYGP